MMAAKPEETMNILDTLGTNYRHEVMPWVLADKKKTSTGERREKKRVRQKLDLTDEKSVESFYYAMINNVRKRTKKLKREQ